MLKIDDIDFPLESVMELRETYPKAVLESEWNPVIAQLNLLKRRGHLNEQGENSLRLTAPQADLPFDYKA